MMSYYDDWDPREAMLKTLSTMENSYPDFKDGMNDIKNIERSSDITIHDVITEKELKMIQIKSFLNEMQIDSASFRWGQSEIEKIAKELGKTLHDIVSKEELDDLKEISLRSEAKSVVREMRIDARYFLFGIRKLAYIALTLGVPLRKLISPWEVIIGMWRTPKKDDPNWFS